MIQKAKQGCRFREVHLLLKGVSSTWDGSYTQTENSKKKGMLVKWHRHGSFPSTVQGPNGFFENSLHALLHCRWQPAPRHPTFSSLGLAISSKTSLKGFLKTYVQICRWPFRVGFCQSFCWILAKRKVSKLKKNLRWDGVRLYYYCYQKKIGTGTPKLGDRVAKPMLIPGILGYGSQLLTPKLMVAILVITRHARYLYSSCNPLGYGP